MSTLPSLRVFLSSADTYRVSNLEARAGPQAWDDFPTLARGIKGEIQLVRYSQKLQLNLRADFLQNPTRFFHLNTNSETIMCSACRFFFLYCFCLDLVCLLNELYNIPRVIGQDSHSCARDEFAVLLKIHVYTSETRRSCWNLKSEACSLCREARSWSQQRLG